MGDIALTKLVELVEHASTSVLYVDKTSDDFDPHLDWLKLNYVDSEKSMLLSVFEDRDSCTQAKGTAQRLIEEERTKAPKAIF